MAARKTTVTHADGSTSTRTSQSRIYTHAVEVGPAPADALAAHKIRQAEDAERSARALREAAENGRVTIKSRGFAAPEMCSHVAKLSGTDLDTWCSADGRTEDYSTTEKEIVKVGRYMRDYARRCAASKDEYAAKLRADAADIQAVGTPVGAYGIVRWSSRADLAAKALTEFDHFTREGRTVRVVPVDPTS